MVIAKLSKEELKDGLTLELVNKISMKVNYSPVQLKADVAPINIMACSSGFWILEEGKAVKGNDGKYIVLSERECQIGRARYLLNHGAEEKEAKVRALMETWKTQIRERIASMEHEQNKIRMGFLGFDPVFVAMAQHESYGRPDQSEFITKMKSKINNIEEAWQAAQGLYDKGEYIMLLEALDIKKFDNPMLSVKMDDADGMKVLTNTFHKSQFDKWDGDMLYMYAKIEIEKQYPV